MQELFGAMQLLSWFASSPRTSICLVPTVRKAGSRGVISRGAYSELLELITARLSYPANGSRTLSHIIHAEGRQSRPRLPRHFPRVRRVMQSPNNDLLFP